MGRSQAVSRADVVKLFRLGHELDEVRYDREAQTNHLLDTLRQITHCRAAFFNEALSFRPRQTPTLLRSDCVADFDESELAATHRLTEYVVRENVNSPDLSVQAFSEHIQNDPIACQRQSLISDREYYASEFAVDWWAGTNLDDSIYGAVPLSSDGHMLMVGVHRAKNDIRFASREQKLLQLFLDQFGHYLVRISSLHEQYRRLDFLPPRLKKICHHLIRGERECDISDAMGLTRNTVHGYIREVFSLFGVNSVSQLLFELSKINDELDVSSNGR